jgi:hypothetical protein
MGGEGIGKIGNNGEEKKMIRKIFLLVTGYWLLVTISGCGYTARSMISNKFKTIYVVPFVNKIDITRESSVAAKYRLYKPMLETDVTKAVTNKFLFDGNLRPTREEFADLILRGEVAEFRRDPLRYTDNDEVEEYRINIIVNLKLWDRKKDKLVWEENNFRGDYTYFTSYSTAGTPKTDDAAVVDAINDLARRIVERTVEQW